jgi:hypothetical protein
MMPTGSTAVAVHGTRARWLAATKRDGLTKDDSACFLLRPAGPDATGAGQWRRSILMAIFFGMAMSTLRQWTAASPNSYRDWYRDHPDRLPVLTVWRPPQSWHRLPAHAWRGYLCRLRSEFGRTAPYLKVRDAGGCPPDALMGTVRVTVDDVAAAEEALQRDGIDSQPLDDRPFYRKLHESGRQDWAPTNGGAPAVSTVAAGQQHPAAVLRAPLLCRALASHISMDCLTPWAVR